ncbi:desmoglein-2-like [Polyodon spathula]|uniref:desmoglein-2-like n=1 Tax=Polyodon spathula TaxID=7913 RepID=UPI001B7EEA62|nr:desmoglein-2-like [Polyodon spathula]
MAGISFPGIGLLLLFMLMVLESHVKAEWIVPPVKIRENEDYSSKNPIAKIRSDVKDVVKYEIVGEGADQKPYRLFIINPDSGEISITAIVDREEKAIYELKGRAYNAVGKQVESDIDLKIKIEDVNDNSPRFTQKTFSGSVYELSERDTFVMQINATDADEPNSRNSLIAYEILEQSPAEMFYVERNTGRIMVAQSTLDRETQSKYTLTVQAKDLDGELGGLATTVQLDIKIKDVNDNAPALEMQSYEGSVVENTKDVEVLRMKALDADEEFSDNWLAVFEIESGNEGGYFRIETDAKTNEGILILQKEVDYEELQSLALGVVVRNKAAFHSSVTITSTNVNINAGGGGGGGSGFGSGGGSSSSFFTLKQFPVKIKVKNEPEGPKFIPKVKAIYISEETSKVDLSKVIAKYPAINADTGKIAEKVKYVKKYDPDNWLIIDLKTGDIKLAKVPDRESKFLVNGTYTAEILAITDDLPAKTATGTVAIQVEDFNDHCPVLTSTSTDMCSDEKSVVVTAVDEDADPNSVPFKYEIFDEPKGTVQNWKIEHLNGTSMLLRPTKTFWPGQYSVTLLIYDQQGKSCSDKQVLNIAVCTCENTRACVPVTDRLQSTGARLGPAAIGLMILALLLLLLVPLLLLFCSCGAGAAGGFVPITDGSAGHLISYDMEKMGEDKAVPHLVPSMVKDISGGGGSGMKITGFGESHMSNSNFVGSAEQNRRPRRPITAGYDVVGSGYGSGYEAEWRYSKGGSVDAFEGVALPEAYLEEYYVEKANYVSAEGHPQKDAMLVYDYEGQGTPVGSIGSCSFIEEDLDQSFLNELGPKFKTLAEICRGTEMTSGVSVEQPGVAVQHTTVSTNPVITNNCVVTNKTVEVTSPVPAPQVQKNVVVTENVSPPQPTVYLQKNVVVSDPGFVQQPVYYATNPIIQTTRYIVEPQIQRNVVIERSSVPGLQGHLLMSDVPSTQNVMVTQKRLVHGSGNQGGMMVGLDQGTLRTSEIPNSQHVLLLENRGFDQGSMHFSEPVSHNVVLTEKRVVSGHNVQGDMMGYELGSLHRNVMPGSQNVMVTEKTVVSDSSMQGGKMGFGQGTLRMSEMPKSQNVVLLENKGFDQGSMRLSEPVSHNVVSGHNVQGDMMGYELGSLHRNVMPGSQNVTVTEKTVVSESSMQGGKVGFGQGTLRMSEMPNAQHVTVTEKSGIWK